MSIFKYYSLLDSILNSKSKLSFYLIIIVIFFSNILEAASIGLIFPILSFITQDFESIQNLKIFDFFFSKNIDKSNLLERFLYLFLLFFSLKTLLFLVIIFFKNYLLNSIVFNLTKDLVSSYIFSPIRTLQINSGEIIRNLNNEISFFRKFLENLINLIIEVVLVVFIIIILAIISPAKVMLNMLTLFLAIYVIYFFSFKYYKIWGSQRSENTTGKLETIINIINNIKEIKIYKSENFFLKSFLKKIKILFYIEVKESFFSQSIRPILELMLIFFLFILLGKDISKMSNYSTLLPLLGLYFGAAFRLVPSFNRILISIQGIQYTISSLEIVSKEIRNLNKNKIENNENKTPIEFKETINIKNLHFSYNKKIFEKTSFNIIRGETVGILGESGSGKSTLVDIILGFKNPNIGEIHIDGKLINFKNYYWSKNIGYIGQKIPLFNGTLVENISFSKFITKKEEIRVRKLLDICRLYKHDGFAPSLIIHENGKNLSFGQIQRIGLVRALFKEPKILILDEPTSALDKDTEIKFIDSLAEIIKNITTIIISHNSYPLSICNKKYKIENYIIKNFND